MPDPGDQVYVKLLPGVTVGFTITEVDEQVKVPVFPELDKEIIGAVVFETTVTTFPLLLVAQLFAVLVTTKL